MIVPTGGLETAEEEQAAPDSEAAVDILAAVPEAALPNQTLQMLFPKYFLCFLLWSFPFPIPNYS